MKAFAFIIAILGTAFSSFAELTLEDVSPHFSTNTEFVWKVPKSEMPKSFWVYKKLPRIFSENTISNAIMLASLQSKGFPRPSTNQIVIWADHTDSEPEPPYFAIFPDTGQMTYTLGDRAPDSPAEYLKDGGAVERAWDTLEKLGVNRAEFVKTNIATDGEWGVFLPCQIDGIQVYGESSGFSFQQFGKDKKIRVFSIIWPNLERFQKSQAASPAQIISCIKAHKIPVAPPQNEEFNYFDKIKELSKAKKVIITKLTPFYSEGTFGEAPINNEPPKFVYPLAELEAVVDFGNSNAVVKFLSPIISSEVSRLLKN